MISFPHPLCNEKVSSVIFYNRTVLTAELPAGFTSSSKPACALRVHVRNFFCRLGGTQTAYLLDKHHSYLCYLAGLLDFQNPGLRGQNGHGFKSNPLQALIIWKLMQWMDYNSQHFLQGPQFPVHPALTAAEIDARRAESLNQAATPPQANQTREKRGDHYSRKRPASAASCARAGPVGSCSPGTPARHRSAPLRVVSQAKVPQRAAQALLLQEELARGLPGASVGWRTQTHVLKVVRQEGDGLLGPGFQHLQEGCAQHLRHADLP